MGVEQQVFMSNPNLADTDMDLLDDLTEAQLGTDLTMTDTDEDGINDFDEVNTFATNPLLPDTDMDGFTDLEEINAGSDPLDENSIPSSEPEVAQVPMPTEAIVLMALLLSLLSYYQIRKTRPSSLKE